MKSSLSRCFFSTYVLILGGAGLLTAQSKPQVLTSQTAVSQSRPPVKENAAHTPNKVGIFYCRGGLREFAVSDQSFEIGDTWNGVVSSPLICGACFFANAPPSAPDLNNPITVHVDWGDGQTESGDFTSNHLTVGTLTLGLRTLTGTHVYKSAVTPPHPITMQISALCEDDQGQWRETVDNTCSGTVYYGCTPHPASVGVYPPDPPSNATIARDVIHGQRTAGALSVVLQDDAPPSGTKLMITSSNLSVLFPQFGSPSTATSIVLVAPGQHAGNFDIDATKARRGATFTISVQNMRGGGTPVVTQSYSVK
jgi:hypothetical protein